ncbi:glycosyltransferase family 4 protein [Salinivirga cyanobacteriivorans]
MENRTKKRIVCVHLYNDYSGAPLVLSEVINGLSARGHQIDLFTSGKNAKGFLSNLEGVKHHYFHYRWTATRYINFFRFFFNQFFLFFIFLRYWRKDVIFYVNTLWPFAAALAGKLTGKKVIYHLHETSVKPKRLKRFLFRILDKSASDVIYVSKYLKQKDPVKQTHPHVVYNALSPDFTDNIKPRGKTDEFTVLMLCSLKKYKGIKEFIQLAARLSNVHFDLVVSASEEDLNAYFKNDRFPENMSLYPAQVDVHPFYSKASLVINLSHPDKWLESFGLTVLEAMNYGIPAIVPPHGGISELVEDGHNGYKISVKKMDKITEVIHEISQDTALHQKLSKNAREMARKFDYKSMIDSIEAIVLSD